MDSPLQYQSHVRNGCGYRMKYYFELIQVFAFKEILTRYKGSVLGPLWVVLHPLLLTAITTLVFSVFINIPTSGIPYVAFVLSGLIPWLFFSQSVSHASYSLIWNRELVTKTAFPKATLPIAYTVSKVVDLLVRCAVFSVMLYFLHFTPSVHWLLILLLWPFQFIFSVGVGLLLATLNALFRDIGYIQEALLLFWFYLTPVVYPETLVPKEFYALILLNPIANALTIYRKLLFQHIYPSSMELTLFISSSLIMFFIGIKVFKKYEPIFADYI